MKSNEKTIIDNVAVIFSGFVPELCETLDLVEGDDQKFAMIGATTEMLLEVLINQWLYGDFTTTSTDETDKQKIKIAYSLTNGCIDRLAERLTEANA